MKYVQDYWVDDNQGIATILNQFENESARTNNHLEGFNNRLNPYPTMTGLKKPKLYVKDEDWTFLTQCILLNNLHPGL